jgi:hypothetical protein
MPELGELAAVALAAEVVDECPFPHEDEQHNRSNDFSNVPATLGRRLRGGADRNIAVTVRGVGKSMPLAFQAHHLIPGTSIKHAKKLQALMTAGSEVKGDVGYDQNDKRNGRWLPALHRFEGWGALSKDGGFEVQFAYAYYAMTTTGRQFHMGDASHKDYNAFVRRTLEEIRLKVLELHSDCKKCEDRMQKPWDPPYQLVDQLFDLATRMDGYVTGPTDKWEPPYCTSDYAVLVGQGMTPARMAGL